MDSNETIFSILNQADYLRQRQAPAPGDPSYLHLADLARALSAHSTREQLRVLDYGCGSSPYQHLFPNAKFTRADIEGQQDLDFTIKTDGSIDAADNSFDLILSTQVLEHLIRPESYLHECHRLLKPGGALLLSTHGTFVDHGCPHDYHRWTAEGLRHAVTSAGFCVTTMDKLTTGPRAAWFLFEMYVDGMHPRRGTLLWAATLILRRTVTNHRHRFHTWVEEQFPGCESVPDTSPRQVLYIGLITYAIKPISCEPGAAV